MARAKLVLFDLDGTLYLDGAPFPGARELLRKFADSDLEYCFVTNNDSLSPADYCERLQRIGFPVEPQRMLVSCEAAVEMLRTLKVPREIYILGTEKLRQWMAGQGYTHTFDEAKAVLVGFDRELSFAKLTEATMLVKRGLPLYATHADMVCPPGLPEAGMLLAALQAAQPGVTVRGIGGKPHRWFVEVLRRRFHVEPEEMVMVGDLLATDISFGWNNGLRTMLILNGKPLPEMPPHRKPDAVVPRIAQMQDEFWPRNLGW